MGKKPSKSSKHAPQNHQKVISPSKLRRLAEEANRDRPQFPTEGMARCISNDGMEDDLTVGEIVYLREIPNMAGHCVILRNKKMPLVGYHLDRFELLAEDDV